MIGTRRAGHSPGTSCPPSRRGRRRGRCHAPRAVWRVRANERAAERFVGGAPIDASAIAAGEGGVWLVTPDGITGFDDKSGARFDVPRTPAPSDVVVQAEEGVFAASSRGSSGTVWRIDPATDEVVWTTHLPNEPADEIAAAPGAEWVLSTE